MSSCNSARQKQHPDTTGVHKGDPLDVITNDQFPLDPKPAAGFVPEDKIDTSRNWTPSSRNRFASSPTRRSRAWPMAGGLPYPGRVIASGTTTLSKSPSSTPWASAASLSVQSCWIA